MYLYYYKIKFLIFTGTKGAYVSTGHNCWGILWAPVCGAAMSELIVKGSCSLIDISPFSISRFIPQAERVSRGRKVGKDDIGEQW